VLAGPGLIHLGAQLYRTVPYVPYYSTTYDVDPYVRKQQHWVSVTRSARQKPALLQNRGAGVGCRRGKEK